MTMLMSDSVGIFGETTTSTGMHPQKVLYLQKRHVTEPDVTIRQSSMAIRFARASIPTTSSSIARRATMFAPSSGADLSHLPRQ
jgi:hypothetical protein